MKKNVKVAAIMLFDIVMMAIALYVSCQLCYDMNAPADVLYRARNAFPALACITLLALWFSGVYRTMWRYASIDLIIPVFFSSAVGIGLTYALAYIHYMITGNNLVFLLQRSTYLVCLFLFIFVIGGSRLLGRMMFEMQRGGRMSLRAGKGRRIMVIGAGWAGSTVIRDIRAGRYGDSQAVIAVDDDVQKKGTRILGVPVVMGTDKIGEYVKAYGIEDIIIAIATPSGDLKELIEECSITGCRLRMVSKLSDVKTGQEAISRVRDVNITDLLGRPEKELDTTSVESVVRNKVILITGGGGSIGSEIARQVMTFAPRRLVIYDINENYMYDLQTELQDAYGKKAEDVLVMRVGSVTDPVRLDTVFTEYKPEVVIHAAAHKHVPLMEDCPEQAVKNNVFGTLEAAQCAIRHKVKRFVMISTDKAVNPTNVMGATKRMAEIIIESLQDNGTTQFTAVRFGNVLASHGSVVPKFEWQIRRGGPVTLTHPEIIRYFMTIPEAASLVLQAASIAKGGELFVLDMGEPVKIRELAERMIRLYADPDAPPVEIMYTGLRPGEKLYEELLMDIEGVTRTGVEKIFVTKPECFLWDEVEKKIALLKKCLDEKGDIVACLHMVIPTYYEADKLNQKHLDGALSS